MPRVATRKKSAGISPYTPIDENAVIAERRLKVVELIVGGIRKPRDIAERLGVSQATVSNDLKVVEKEMTNQAIDLVSQVRDRERMVEWMHIEELRSSLMLDVSVFEGVNDKEYRISHEDKHRAIGKLINLAERKAKLLGLDMPTKTALTDPTGENEYKGIPKETKHRFLGTTEIKIDGEIEDAEITGGPDGT